MQEQTPATAPSGETPAKRGPGRPRKSDSDQPRATKAGAWIYDDSEELVFVEGADAADEVICDGAAKPGLSIDYDGTRIWNCALVGGCSALRTRLRYGDAKAGAKLAEQRPTLKELYACLRDRKRCVSWGGATTILQYVFKPQVVDTRLSSPKSSRGCLVALRQSVAQSGFLRDVLHGPLIIDFTAAEVPDEIVDNALDIAAWIREGLHRDWGNDPKTQNVEPTPDTAPTVQVNPPPLMMNPPPATPAPMIPLDATPVATAEIPEPVAPAEPPAEPEPFTPRTASSYLSLSLAIKASTEHAELGTGDTLANILDAVKGECEWPKWGLAAATAEIRAAKTAGDETTYKTLKRTRLPIFYPSATWKRPRREKANIDNVSGTTGIVCLDFDHFATPEEAETARTDFACANRDHIIICALSCSGRGFFALVCGNTGSTPETYKAEAARLMDWARSQGYEPDVSCMDVTRGRILSVDRDADFVAPDWPITPPVHALTVVEPPKRNRATASADGGNDPTKRPSKKRITAFVARATERVTAAPVGNRNSALTSACGTATRLCDLYGYDRQDAEDRLRWAAETSGLDSKEIESILKRYGPLSGK